MNYNPILDYARAREDVRMNKERGAPKPWTSDAILQQYKFCNVFRVDDTVTKWIKQEVIDRCPNDQYLPAMLALCRWVNHVDCLEDIMFGGPYGKFYSQAKRKSWFYNKFYALFTNGDMSGVQLVIRARMDANMSAWTGAYMIRAESNRKQPWYDWPKEKYIAEIVVAPIVEMCSHHYLHEMSDSWDCAEDGIGFGDTIEHTTNLMALQYGWGHFMAYEVATDLTYAKGWLGDAPDLRTWANAGPGAVRGLNRLHGRELTSVPNKAQTLAEMVDILPWFDKEFGRCKLRDVEHTLCEFDKYERVRLGEGRPRSKYNGMP